MRRLISPETMLQTEKRYFAESGISSETMMEYAASELVSAVQEYYPDAHNIFIACGPGGNGGDGYACARKLQHIKRSCRIIAPIPPKSPDAILNCNRARAMGIPIFDSAESFPCPDLWIDCLYGTGLSRAPSGAAAALIRRMNADPAPVLSADIPSGLNGRTGVASDPCVNADITVSFQLAKFGHLLQDGLDMSGRLLVPDIGFPPEIFTDTLPQIEPQDLANLFIPRKRNIHKSTCGHLLIIAGSFGMAGAAALCANAALRSGVGLVTIACPEDIVPILQTLAPEAMCISLCSEDAFDSLQEGFKGKNAIVIGPGITRKFPPHLLKLALESNLPTVIDADALNIIAEHHKLRALLKPCHVLTPHPGEAARLLGRSCTDPIRDAQELARFGSVAVLKGASRVISNESATVVSSTGACGMARGGSGDIFAGILGALLADPSGRTPIQSAMAACEIHGLAGMLAQQKYGAYAMNSADIIEFLPEVFRRYVERA